MFRHRADVAQLVEHVIGNDEVSSSILLIGSKSVLGYLFPIARVAQLVEHFTRNEKVGSSILPSGSRIYRILLY